jgi:hypothetical protein
MVWGPRLPFHDTVAVNDDPDFRAFGRSSVNLAVSTTRTDIWEEGGVKVWMTANDNIEVYSSDVNDTAAGTGGLWLRVVHSVAPDGATMVKRGVPVLIPEMTDVRFSAKKIAGGASGAVGLDLSGYISAGDRVSAPAALIIGL